MCCRMQKVFVANFLLNVKLNALIVSYIILHRHLCIQGFS